MVKDVLNKENLILMIARSERGMSIPQVRKFYNALEDIVFKNLSSLDKENDELTIKLLEGVSLIGKYEPAKKKKVNYITNGNNEILVDSNIKVKAKVTKNYQKKLSEQI